VQIHNSFGKKERCKKGCVEHWLRNEEERVAHDAQEHGGWRPHSGGERTKAVDHGLKMVVLFQMQS
jgi:hypothetical protein